MCDRRRDAGQAFPIYIVVVAGLLFLAFAFFAVGQAAALRNGTQTAADSAALAAGTAYRDRLGVDLLDAVRGGKPLEDLLEGLGPDTGEACAKAQTFAEHNGAALDGGGCVPDSFPTSFSVTVKSTGSVGNSVIPGTEGTHSSAKAKSVVSPRCVLGPPDPADGKGDDNSDEDKGQDENKGKEKPSVHLTCEGGTDWHLDPDDLRELPEAADLFSVRLAE